MAAAPTLGKRDLVIVLPTNLLDPRPDRTAPSLITGEIRGSGPVCRHLEWLREGAIHTSNGEMS